MEVVMMTLSRFKCPDCGSIHTKLFELKDENKNSDIWHAELKCGKCGHPIYEWGR